MNTFQPLKIASIQERRSQELKYFTKQHISSSTRHTSKKWRIDSDKVFTSLRYSKIAKKMAFRNFFSAEICRIHTAAYPWALTVGGISTFHHEIATLAPFSLSSQIKGVGKWIKRSSRTYRV
jgi:hypothetical protein